MTDTETRTGVTKADLILSYELALLAAATRYDTENGDVDRHRSAEALAFLFFDIAKIVQPNIFIEAGAKAAGVSRRAVRRLGDIRVVAFEANPFVYEKYKHRSEDTPVEYFHLALTDSPGPVTFNVLTERSGEPIVNGRSSLFKRSDNRRSQEVTVDGTTLDTFFADENLRNAVLWVDVEGATGLVLNGAHRVLQSTAVLLIEVEEREVWGPEHWLRPDVTLHLWDAGFRPIARDFEYEHQHNVIYVRQDLLQRPQEISWALVKFMSGGYDPAPSVPASPTGRRLADRLQQRAKRVTEQIRAKAGSTGS